MRELRISPDLALPLEAVTETFVILAKRGSGKTYTAAVMAEEMLAADLPVIVIDPIGVWHGLRSSADGKSPGYPVVIFGGEHADVPLEESAGALIADVLIDQRFPAVLDLSLLSKSAARRFMTAFLARLYHRNRDPLHVIIDEADMFAPQSTGRSGGGDTAPLLGAMEDLVRRGRARGIGATLITQRPAVLHKDVLSQAEVLVALRMTGVRDVNAIDEWVKLHADEDQAREVKHSLPALPIGTAWVWSPGWLGILQKVAVRRRRTFDSSATPKMGERRVTPRTRADIDLDALGAQIAATVERAKADDPRELRKRVAQLERELADERARTPEPVEVRVEVPVLNPEIVDQIEAALSPAATLLGEAQETLAKHRMWAEQQLDKPAPRRPAQTPVIDRPTGHSTRRSAQPTSAPRGTISAARPVDDGTSTSIGKGERIILTAVAQYPDGVTREQLTVLTGYKRSTRDAYIQRLRQAEHIVITGSRITATDTGIDTLGDDYQPLPTGAALRAHWLATLPEGEARILAVLLDAYPDGVARDVITDRTDYKRSTRDAYLQRLRARQLITTNGDPCAADVLFESA